jgi:uncharacterized repeat protein (TIGR03803 family)
VKTLSFGYTLGIGTVIAAFLTGCGGSQSPMGSLQANVEQSRIQDTSSGLNYRVLFGFGKYANEYRGASPTAALIDVKGILYGTTTRGGHPSYNSGTIFSITPGGRQHVLYTLSEIPDGADPPGALVYVNGKLYGTAYGGGGSQGDGTVFNINTDGTDFHVLHAFAGGSDGAQPLAGLVAAKGWLYGTTSWGGSGPSGNGTVFGIRLSDGQLSIVHRFTGEPDGRYPAAPLTYVGGTLYGTTVAGGKNNLGSVFSVHVANGKESVLYSFSGTDGASPQAGLLLKNGTLYGTTAEGGAYSNDGTVFSVDPSGSGEHVLHNFAGSDGRFPQAGLISDPSGTLYGTTHFGGVSGYGTLFSINASGDETILHNFNDGVKHDGIFPEAPLLYVKSKLFGTTYAGGRHGHRCLPSDYCDYGTVFVQTL